MHQVPGNTVITLPSENNHCSAWVRLYRRWTFLGLPFPGFVSFGLPGTPSFLNSAIFTSVSWCALSGHTLAVLWRLLSPSCTLSFYPWTTTLLSLHPPLDTPNHFRGMNSVYKPMTANPVLALTLSPELPSPLPTCQLYVFGCEFRMVLCITCNCILWDSFSSTYLSTVTQACCIKVSEAQESSCLKHTLLPFLWP